MLRGFLEKVIWYPKKLTSWLRVFVFSILQYFKDVNTGRMIYNTMSSPYRVLPQDISIYMYHHFHVVYRFTHVDL